MIKKTIISLMMAGWAVLCLNAQEPFLVNISGSLFAPADGFFQDTYGKTAAQPELRAGFKLRRNLYLLTGYSHIGRSAEPADLDRTVKSSQHYIFAGLGFYPPLSERIDYSAEFGIFHLFFKDPSEDPVLDLGAFGLGFDLGLIFHFGSRLYAQTSVGYLTASRDIDTRSLKMGGTRARLGLGIRF